MPFENVYGFGDQDGKMITFASGRDFGNVAAGFVAGKEPLGWGIARLGFDGLESIQQRSFATEAPTTQLAEKIGYDVGLKTWFNSAEGQRLWKEAITPIYNRSKLLL